MIKQYFFHKKAFDIFYRVPNGDGGLSAYAYGRFIGVFRISSNRSVNIASKIDTYGVYFTLKKIEETLHYIKR